MTQFGCEAFQHFSRQRVRILQHIVLFPAVTDRDGTAVLLLRDFHKQLDRRYAAPPDKLLVNKLLKQFEGSRKMKKLEEGGLSW